MAILIITILIIQVILITDGAITIALIQIVLKKIWTMVKETKALILIQKTNKFLKEVKYEKPILKKQINKEMAVIDFQNLHETNKKNLEMKNLALKIQLNQLNQGKKIQIDLFKIIITNLKIAKTFAKIQAA